MEEQQDIKNYRIRYEWAYLVLFIFALVLIFWIIPWQVPSSSFGEMLTPRFFPYCVGIMIAVFSFVLWIRELIDKITKRKMQAAFFPRPFFKEIGAILAVFFLYVMLIGILGYATASLMALMIFFKLAGFRSWKKVLIVSFLTIGILYLGLTKGLDVQFPEGIVW